MNDLIKYYRLLLKFAKDERELLLREQFESLSDILDKKDRCIEELKKMDAVNRHREEKLLNKELKVIIEEAISVENENYKIMSEKKGVFKDRLNDIYRGKRLLSGYYTSYQNVPRFVDIKK